MEQLGRIVTSTPSATLGDVVKHLRANETVTPPLLKGLEELWGWTSTTDSVRHGASADTLSPDETEYVFALASAALGLLLAKDAT